MTEDETTAELGGVDKNENNTEEEKTNKAKDEIKKKNEVVETKARK